jgi:3-dehydroquinate dehydratase-2
MKLIIINGPNLNLLGQREKDIYGNQNFESFFGTLKANYPQVDLALFQSNHQGALIDKIHEVGFSYDGIVINGAGFTHTSVALRDAIAAVNTPALEVHISNIGAREDFREHSYLTAVCVGMISGLGLEGYSLGIQYFVNRS